LAPQNLYIILGIREKKKIKNVMKNREIIMRRLERAEGEVEKLHLFLNRGGSREQVEEVLITLREALDDAKVFIQQEPLSPGEVNRF
jgi:hypothetical protein